MSGRIVIAILTIAILMIGGSNTLDVLSQSNFHEEVRILYHHDPTRTNSKDYIGQFLSAFPQPFLYAHLTKVALNLGVDLILVHKLLTLVCAILLLIGAAIVGLRFGGGVAALAMAVLIVAQPIYHYQINSATPHAFAFPLLFWGLACLLYERPYLLAGLTVLSGLLYPPISPVLGLSLAWHLVITRKCLAGQNPNRISDILALGLAGVISLALLWHQLTPIEGYGVQLVPGAKADIYPENGPNGRHFYGVFNPLAYVFVITFGQFRQALLPEIILLLMLGFTIIAGYGLYRLPERAEILQPFLSFIIPSLIFCVLIVLLRSFLAYRFVLYPLFTVLPALFVFGLLMLGDAYREKLRHPAATFVVVMALFIVSLNSVDAVRNGFRIQLDEPSHRLMDFVRRLPADSLLATWPDELQTGLIPYIAGRPLLVTRKAHYPTYEGHIINMRERMFDLVDAYLAIDIEPLIRLHCRWQVDYLVVNREHFTGDEPSLEYFAPFNERIEKILSTTEKSEMILRQPPSDAIIFQAGKHTLVDLARLSEGAVCPPRP